MAFKYSCFVSYCHGQHGLVTGFIDQLVSALKAELEAFLDEEVYIDSERLKPGYKYNEKLAEAICQSVCMLVVYSPRYERHEYCIREYEAMAQIEQKRTALLGASDGRGFIIPIILRGADDIPDRIKKHVHYNDRFAKFTLAATDLIRNPEFIGEIQKIAAVIYEHYRDFEHATVDPCSGCSTFVLPAPTDLKPWRDKPAQWPPAFVNR
jgi:hypothetical protein